MAATKDAVLERRAEFFDEYVHTPQVALEPKRRTAVVSAPAAQRARRNSAPTTFSLNEGRRALVANWLTQHTLRKHDDVQVDAQRVKELCIGRQLA
ncbi:hypothetical protein T492DRAFT_893442 [Pavlovales sp. CCMP2436]|nr:hypothetical protein T492DRAFT_893442 [Pavlovales sp. CCMP2436]